MADEKENCVRMTRAATKRKASMAATIDEGRVNKKRVVLGELPNMSNLSVPNLEREIKKPRKSAARAPMKQRKDTSALDPNSDIDTRSDDPQMCGPYVSSIFDYLRQMEVRTHTRTHLQFSGFRNSIWVSCIIVISGSVDVIAEIFSNFVMVKDLD